MHNSGDYFLSFEFKEEWNYEMDSRYFASILISATYQ